MLWIDKLGGTPISIITSVGNMTNSLGSVGSQREYLRAPTCRARQTPRHYVRCPHVTLLSLRVLLDRILRSDEETISLEKNKPRNIIDLD